VVLGIVALACFTVIFALLFFLVDRQHPKIFKVKAAVTKWISVEVELHSSEPTVHQLLSADPDRQQQTAATASSPDDQDHPASAS
jgi:hypothetical protein